MTKTSCVLNRQMGAAESSQGEITSFCTCATPERPKIDSFGGRSEQCRRAAYPQTPRSHPAPPYERVGGSASRELPQGGGSLQQPSNTLCGSSPETTRLRGYVGDQNVPDLLSPRRLHSETFLSPGDIATRQAHPVDATDGTVSSMHRKITVEQATCWAKQFRNPRVASEGLYSKLKPESAAGSTPKDGKGGTRSKIEQMNGGSGSPLSPKRTPAGPPSLLLAMEVLGITQSQLEKMIVQYQAASPVERSVFEGQMSNAEKSVFFRAMFEQRAFPPPGSAQR